MGSWVALAEEPESESVPLVPMAASAGDRRGVVSLQRLSALRGLPTEEVQGELTSAGVHPPSAEPAWVVPESLPAPSLDLADLDALLEDEDGA